MSEPSDSSRKLKLNSKMSKGKIPGIQLIRALAVVLVMLFHYTVAYSPKFGIEGAYPWGDYFAGSILRFGYIGVYIFFMISGFVIFGSLERSQSLKEFAIARLTRIYIPLWLLIPPIYILAQLSPFKELRSENVWDIFSSMTLLNHKVIEVWTHNPVKYVDSVLWTLWIEIIFYLIAALIFRYFKNRTLEIFVVVSLVTRLISYLSICGGVSEVDHLMSSFGLKYYSWFTLGMLAFRKYTGKSLNRHSLWVVVVGLTAVISIPDQLTTALINRYLVVVISIVFYLLILRATKMTVLSEWTRIPLLVGNASFEIYLIHLPVGNSLIAFLSIKSSEQEWAYGLFVLIILFFNLFLGIFVQQRITSPASEFCRRQLSTRFVRQIP